MFKSIALKNYFDFDKRLYFLLICGAYLCVMYIYQDMILHDSLYYEAYSEQLAPDRIEAIIQFNRKWSWLSYVLMPVILLLRISVVSLCILAGVLLAEYKVSYRRIFQIVLIAEAVYLIPVAINLTYFLWIASDYSLADIQHFDIYSLRALVGTAGLEGWLSYLLASLNMIELMYWLTLAYGFYIVMQGKSYSESFALVATSYGTAWLLWVAGITFLIVSLAS
jgi:hypothetical protein